MNKFIYVFDEDAKAYMESLQYILLKENTKDHIYIFENKPCERFEFSKIRHVFSDTLTF